jgi:cytochrome c oxidase subunit 2
VIGHQWWWEFDYPTLGFKTANEVYLPIGRTVNFTLKSADVIHSFWIPELGGKRDVVSNRTNYLWYTPDSVSDDVFNGFCAEYCGTSHANMRFKAFTVSQAEFDSWAKHEASPAVALDTGSTPRASARTAAAAPQAAPSTASFIAFDRSKIPAYAVPATPIPAGLTIDSTLVGNPVEGEKLMATSMDALCMSCHTIRGNPRMAGVIGPDLTHIASRSSIAGGLFPNDRHHLELWIKNARLMKPGVKMYTFGVGQFDPETGKTSTYGKLTDQQIADIVAYLQTLK